MQVIRSSKKKSQSSRDLHGSNVAQLLTWGCGPDVEEKPQRDT